MKRLFILLLSFSCPFLAMGQTLEQCYEWAEKNSPIIERYDLIDKSSEYTLEAASKAWLPSIVLSGQATYQSAVSSFPEAMTGAFSKMGVDFEGLHRDQYRFSLDVNQTLWDGGATASQKKVIEAERQAQRQDVTTQVYGLRGKVNSLFFGILVLQQQKRLNAEYRKVLQGNKERIQVLVDEGTASESDRKTIEAELLEASQNSTSIDASLKAYRSMLALFTGHPTDSLQMPEEPGIGESPSARPELELFDLKLKSVDAREAALNSTLYPRVSAFAQGFYGNPGLNMFDDMMHSHFSWNYIVGLRFQWNIGSFFQRSTGGRQLGVERSQIEADKDMFLFNNRMQVNEQTAEIESKRAIAASDRQIVELRQEVRESTERKVENGVASAYDLIKDISAENDARINAATHSIELLKYLYDLKTTTND
jgi:outer membrane protein TolC